MLLFLYRFTFTLKYPLIFCEQRYFLLRGDALNFWPGGINLTMRRLRLIGSAASSIRLSARLFHCHFKSGVKVHVNFLSQWRIKALIIGVINRFESSEEGIFIHAHIYIYIC